MWLKSSLDYFIFSWFCLFAFVALIFEPLYYFGCDWNGLTCPLAASNDVVNHTRNLWMIYAAWDPMFYVVPMWLRVMCYIEVFIFGPLYVITVYGMYYAAPWFSSVALPFAGALIYSTIVYFAMEVIENMPGTNMWLVFAVNLPWTIIPLLLVYRIATVGVEAKTTNKMKLK